MRFFLAKINIYSYYINFQVNINQEDVRQDVRGQVKRSQIKSKTRY